jgi:tetratricopeptide (TPR) repeat protein
MVRPVVKLPSPASLLLLLVLLGPSLAAPALGARPVEAERAWRQASSLIEQGLQGAAMEPMRKAVVLAPDDVQIHCDYQDLMKAQGYAIDVIEEYRARKESHPNDPDALYLYGRATGDPAIAGEVFARAVDLDPTHIWSVQGLGGVAAVEGRLDDAVVQYEAALALEPGRADIHNKVAGIHFARGDVEAAKAAWRSAQQLAPDDYHAFMNMGAVLSMEGDLEAAAALLAEAVTRAPGNPLAYVNLGYVLFKLQRYDDALANFAAALAINPRDRRVAGSRDLVVQVRDGRIPFEAFAPYEKALSASTSDADQAIQHFREVLLLAPDFAVAHMNLGLLLFATGAHDDGLASLRRAAELAPDDVAARYNLGFVLMGREQLPEARDNLEAAADLDPGDVDAVSALALVHLGMGQADRSVSLYRRALELQTRDPVLWLQLSSALASARSLEEAEEAARQALELAPGFTSARVQLVAILREARHFEQALAELEPLELLAPEHPDLAAQRAALEAAQATEDEAAAVPGRVRLSRIYLTDRGVADEVAAKLRSGSSFEQLAGRYGEGAERTRGGDIGFLDPSDLRPELAEAVERLDPGQTSPAVPVGKGWVILKRTR